MLTARTFLVRGLLAGLIAGVLTFAVAYLIGEPSVASAISIEESASSAETVDATADHDHPVAADESATHSHDEGEALVSRSTQATWGLATATVVFGVALGGILGLASAFAAGRLGRLSLRASTMTVTVVGFAAVYLVPYLKYPPNPPAVGNPDTIGDRTSMYFVMLAVSLVAAVAAVIVSRRLAGRMDAWYAALISIAGYGVVVGVATWLLPVFDEVPAGFPADLLWEFRIASLIVQSTLWVVAGLALALMLHQVARRATAAHGNGPVLAASSS